MANGDDLRDPPSLAVLPPAEWVRWLSGTDAALLLMILCKDLEDTAVPHETLITMVRGWRANALEALDAEDWRAQVDGYLEIWADARAWLASQGRL